MTLSLAVLLVLAWELTCGEHIINTKEDFINFSNDVNGGNNCTGKIICLNSDLDFSNEHQFMPIGMNENRCFSGTFDGQGYMISGLRTNNTQQYTGLFGYLFNGKVRSVVLKSDCAIESKYNSNTSYVGGISGVCDSCAIEDTVNMGNVSYNGGGEGSIYMGGITGITLNNETNNLIKNCANYGSITNEQGSIEFIYIGGVAGYFYGGIENSLNYGTIINNGEASSITAIGGITGSGMSCNIYNCLSSGIIQNNGNKSSINIGTILGSNYGGVNISYCFWTSDVGKYNRTGNSDQDVSILNSSLAEQSSSTLGKLNKVASKDSGFKSWTMLHLNAGRIKNCNRAILIVIQSYFPDPVKEGYVFTFWYTKWNKYGDIYNPKSETNYPDLYADYTPNNFTVSFDFENGTTANSTLRFNDNITYPEPPRRDGYEFAGWDPNITKMPAKDITIKATWNEILDIASSAVTGYVEIVFSKKDMKKEEIESIIKEITKENFIIEKIEYNESSGETHIILRFRDDEVAQNFVETIKTEPENRYNIKNVSYYKNKPVSYAQRNFILSLSAISSFL